MPDPAVLNEYRRRYPQACANFEADTALEAPDRDRFLAHLEAYPGGDYEAHVEDFFHNGANKKLGPPVALETGEVLGAVRAMSSFASRFTKANHFDHDPLDAEEFVRDLTFLPADGLRTMLRSLFTPEAQITRHLMWSYRNPPHFHEPFLNIDRTDVVCRLGLPTYGGEHIAFGHQSASAVRIPTSFDAGLIDEWRPGGNTKPLPPCEHKYANGLPEVVHDPNVFHNIATALYSV
jgi:hypothetical protein